MELKAWLDAERGRRARLAGFLTSLNPARPVGVAFVTALVTEPGKVGYRPVPPRLAMGIERFTEGAVMRWDSCPREWWEIWPDLAQQPGAPPIVTAPAPAASLSA
jgi:hypothetical protein